MVITYGLVRNFIEIPIQMWQRWKYTYTMFGRTCMLGFSIDFLDFLVFKFHDLTNFWIFFFRKYFTGDLEYIGRSISLYNTMSILNSVKINIHLDANI